MIIGNTRYSIISCRSSFCIASSFPGHAVGDADQAEYMLQPVLATHNAKLQSKTAPAKYSHSAQPRNSVLKYNAARLWFLYAPKFARKTLFKVCNSDQ